eukprot:6180204-Pleurochrysis_carterae.AAC.7
MEHSVISSQPALKVFLLTLVKEGLVKRMVKIVYKRSPIEVPPQRRSRAHRCACHERDCAFLPLMRQLEILRTLNCQHNFLSLASICSLTFLSQISGFTSSHFQRARPAQLFAVSVSGVGQLQSLKRGGTFLMEVPKFILDREHCLAEIKAAKAAKLTNRPGGALAAATEESLSIDEVEGDLGDDDLDDETTDSDDSDDSEPADPDDLCFACGAAETDRSDVLVACVGKGCPRQCHQLCCR